MQVLPVKSPGCDWAFYAKTFSWEQKAIRDKHSNESWNWFVKSSIPEALLHVKLVRRPQAKFEQICDI